MCPPLPRATAAIFVPVQHLNTSLSLPSTQIPLVHAVGFLDSSISYTSYIFPASSYSLPLLIMLSFSLRRRSAPGSPVVRDSSLSDKHQQKLLPSVSSKKSLSSLFSLATRDNSPRCVSIDHNEAATDNAGLPRQAMNLASSRKTIILSTIPKIQITIPKLGTGTHGRDPNDPPAHPLAAGRLQLQKPFSTILPLR